MLNLNKMIASAEECLGWPYVSPGSNNSSGIDCSGLFCKMYGDQGASIYHGSNKIYRKYCSSTGKINSVSDLEVGMAVFKWKDQQPKGYDDNLGDFCHIGFIVSVNPLRIIHASSEAGCVTTDTKIGKWKYWGKLSAVDYGDSGGSSHSDDPVIEPDKQEEDIIVAIAAVVDGGGKSVKLRAKPSTNEGLYWEISDGTTVTVLKKGDQWSNVKASGRTGYMMTKFLNFEPEDDDFTPDDPYQDEDGNVVVVFTESEAQTLVPLLDKLNNQLVKVVGRG